MVGKGGRRKKTKDFFQGSFGHEIVEKGQNSQVKFLFFFNKKNKQFYILLIFSFLPLMKIPLSQVLKH